MGPWQEHGKFVTPSLFIFNIDVYVSTLNIVLLIVNARQTLKVWQL